MVNRLVQWLRDIFDVSHKRATYARASAKRKKLIDVHGSSINSYGDEIVHGHSHLYTPRQVRIRQRIKERREASPQIEYDSAREFEKYVYVSEHIEAAVWHPNDDTLIAISLELVTDNLLFRCLVFKFSKGGLEKTSEKEVPITRVYGRLLDVSHHPTEPIIVLTFHYHIYVWDYMRAQILANISPTVAHIYTSSGFYPSGSHIWVRGQPTQPLREHIHQSYLWLIFDYLSQSLTMSSVQTDGVRSRGAVLHPSGKLIGVNWSSYGSGFYLHSAIPKKNVLSYYRDNTVRFSELEAYSPSFSPDGRLFAFVLDSVELSCLNSSKIVVYDISSDRIIHSFYHLDTNDITVQLQFGDGGQTLAFYERKSIFVTIWNASNGKKISSLSVGRVVKFLSAHRLRGYYAVVSDNGITVLIDKNTQTVNTEDFDTKSHFYADEYIIRHADKLLEVGDFPFD